ncbi:MAG: choice-of-anchor V domain-containing protein [Flavobacteriales bacterium]
MKKTILTLTLIGVFTVLIAKNSGVGAALGQDRTGSPVGLSTQCGACHNGGSVTPAITLHMLDTAGFSVTSYSPGETYIYEVELSTGGAQQFGFQSVGLFTADNTNAGTLTALSPNTKITTLGSRKYGEQISKTPNGVFQMQWVAPTNAGGEIKFYAAGVAVNGNNSSSGDKAAIATPLVLSENVFFSVNENDKPEIRFYPNPVEDEIQMNIPFTGEVSVRLHDLTGKEVYHQTHLPENNTSIRISLAHLTSGTYVLHVSRMDGSFSQSTTLIKK